MQYCARSKMQSRSPERSDFGLSENCDKLDDLNTPIRLLHGGMVAE